VIPIGALKQLVGQFARCQTVWSTEPRPNMGAATTGPQAYIVLSLGAYTAKGVDDYRQTYDPVQDKLDTVVSGNRLFQLSIRCHSLDPNHQPHDMLERVRIRLQTFTARAIYTANNMAFVRTSGISTFPDKTAGNRALLCAVLDVTFAIASNQDPGDDPGDYITNVDEPIPLSGS
jgi:hypothetical protein